MLTKTDLQLIKEAIRDELKPFKKEFQDVKEKVEDLEIKLDESTSDINLSIFQIRAELKEEAKHIKRRLNELYNSQETIIKFFNEDYLKLSKRIDKVEKILSITS